MIDREALEKAMWAYAPHTSGQPDRDRLSAAITAYLTHAGEGAVPVGWQLVPVAMTADMVLAAHRQIDWCRNDQNTHRPTHESQTEHGGTSCEDDLRDAWRDALAAAPPPPRQDGAREGEATPIGYLVEAWGTWGGTIWPEIDAFEMRDRGHSIRAVYGTPPAPDEAVEAFKERLEEMLDCHHGMMPPDMMGIEHVSWGRGATSGWDRAISRMLDFLRARSRRDVGAA